MRVAVIGAGVSGLAAASEVRALRPDAEVWVFETADRVGGLVYSERRPDGLLLEHGPDSLLTLKPDGVAAICDTGLAGEMVAGTDAPRTAFLARQGALIPLPNGIFAMNPDAAAAVLRSSALSLRAKARLCLEPFMPKRDGPGDESVSEFVKRRLGREFLECLIEPLIAGIHGAPPDRLSARAVLPKLVQLERDHGSLAHAMWKRRSPNTLGPRQAAVVSLRRGMASLPEAMAAALSAHVRLRTPVHCIARSARSGFALDLGAKGRLSVDAVIVATPARAGARLCQTLSPEIADALANIPHAGYASVHLSFRASDVQHCLAGTGLIVPGLEQRSTSACTFMHQKWPSRAPFGTVLLRCFMRPPFGTRADLVERARSDLRCLLGIDAAPELRHAVVHEEALPCYTLGHLERVESIEAAARSLAGFAVAGNALRGAGIPDCIASGKRAAHQALGSA